MQNTQSFVCTRQYPVITGVLKIGCESRVTWHFELVYSMLTLITMIIIVHNSPFCSQTVPCNFRQLMICHWVYLLTYILIAGHPRARSARGTEHHTHGIWSTSFRSVVTWLTERTYACTDCTGRVGETINRKGGVSQASWQVLIFYIWHSQYGQLTAVKTG